MSAMRIAIVGVGAIGSVYALRLSHVTQVVLVVRDLSLAPRAIHGEKMGSNDIVRREVLTAPAVAPSVPDECDVVLLTVRVDQLDDELLTSLATGGPDDRIVVILAPLLPPTYERVLSILGARLVVGMPGVVAYEPEADPIPTERHVRYWTPKISPTLLGVHDQADPRRDKLNALAKVLIASGLPTEVRPRVGRMNAATTIAFFPIIAGLAIAGGSMQRLIDDNELLKLGLAAGREALTLAKAIGELPSFSSLFFTFVSPFTVRAGIKLAKRRLPEVIVFLEKQFGRKLASQNAAMFADITLLASAHGIAIPAIEKLAARLP